MTFVLSVLQFVRILLFCFYTFFFLSFLHKPNYCTIQESANKAEITKTTKTITRKKKFKKLHEKSFTKTDRKKEKTIKLGTPDIIIHINIGMQGCTMYAIPIHAHVCICMSKHSNIINLEFV